MSTLTNYKSAVAPRFFIEADGVLAEDIASDIVKFEFDDDEKKPNELKLTVSNKGGKYTDDPRFAEGVTFRVRWGYAGDISPVYAVVIAKAKPKYPGAGQLPTIEMVAWDLQQEMNRHAHPKNWGKVSSSDIAKEIAKRYSLQAEVEESNDARSAMRTQAASVTDIQYLRSLADKLNWVCYLEDDRLHFHKKRLDAAPNLTFSYFNDAHGTLLEFTPEVKMGKPGKNKEAGAGTKDGKPKSLDSADKSPPMGVYLAGMTDRLNDVGYAPKNDVFGHAALNPLRKVWDSYEQAPPGGVDTGDGPTCDPGARERGETKDGYVRRGRGHEGDRKPTSEGARHRSR